MEVVPAMTIRIVPIGRGLEERRMSKRVALYARISTVTKGQDVETQLIPLRQWAELKGYSVFREYIDVGISGSKERRPALDLLMKDAKQHRFDIVAVARFDRFARSVKHLLAALATFESLQIDFISLNESIDTTTPMGKAVFTILGAIAELERNLIRERVLAGLARARREGKHFGRPLSEDAKHIDPAEVVGRIQQQETIYQIAKFYGVARSTIRRIRSRYEKDLQRGMARIPGQNTSSGHGETPIPTVHSAG